MITIRPAGPADLPEILRIERASFSMPWAEQSLRAELEPGRAFFDAALSEGTVCGFCILHRFGPEGEIFNIAVAEAFRGQGIGRQLLEAALEHARADGMERVFLEVRDGNGPARALYDACGFAEIGRRRGYYDKPVEDAILMQRDCK